MLDKDVMTMQLGNLKNIRNFFQPLCACGLWVCFTLSTVSSDANAQGFGKESDMVKGAKNNSVGIRHHTFWLKRVCKWL